VTLKQHVTVFNIKKSNESDPLYYMHKIYWQHR